MHSMLPQPRVERRALERGPEEQSLAPGRAVELPGFGGRAVLLQDFGDVGVDLDEFGVGCGGACAAVHFVGEGLGGADFQAPEAAELLQAEELVDVEVEGDGVEELGHGEDFFGGHGLGLVMPCQRCWRVCDETVCAMVVA